ncbi:hypothetical protein Goari_020888, partial [Gossypium aridum]|nr:hypothetical protein [Gossypium aridum]
MLLKVRDAEFTGQTLVDEKIDKQLRKILEHETKIKIPEETIKQANLECEKHPMPSSECNLNDGIKVVLKLWMLQLKVLDKLNGFGKSCSGLQNFEGEPRDQFQSNFLNAVDDIHQKLESDLSELGVTEIDDMLLKVKDAEFT